MRILRESNEDEVVLAWLKAELDSPRFKDQLLKILKDSGSTEELIMKPDLTSQEDNQHRTSLLKGYRNWLDKDFSSFTWNLVELSKSDVANLKYIDYDYWNELSDNTSLVGAAAENVSKGKIVFDVDNDPFLLVAEKFDSGYEAQPIIVLGDSKEDLAIIEGHVRATAFMLTKSNDGVLKALMGLSHSS